jgi:hypothetical protein
VIPSHLQPWKSYLDGRVKVLELPTVKPPADPALLKRVTLPQGELVQFHNGQPAMQYLASVDLVMGTVRGNHYHRQKQEYVYVLRGALLLVVRALEGGDTQRIEIPEGGLFFMDTEVAHALVPAAPGVAVEFSPSAFDPADVHRVQLV